MILQRTAQFIQTTTMVYPIRGVFLLLAIVICIAKTIAVSNPDVMMSGKYGEPADYTNLILIGQDVLSGNFFLRGWSFGGITFFWTDMPHCVIGVLLAGLSKASIAISHISIYLVCAFTALPLCRVGTRPLSFFGIAVWLGLVGACLQPSLNVHFHAGLWPFLFMLCFFAEKAVMQDKLGPPIPALVGVFLLICFAMGSDALITVAFILPAGFVCTYVFLDRRNAGRWSKFLWLLGTILLGCIAGVLMEKLYFMIGGAQKNAYVMSSLNFKGWNSIWESFPMYFKTVLGFFSADAADAKIASAQTIRTFLVLPIVLLGYFLIIKNIYVFITQKRFDIVSLLLSLSYATLSIIVFFSMRGRDITMYQRYLSDAIFIFAIIIARDAAFIKECVGKIVDANLIPLKIVGIMCFTILYLGFSKPYDFRRLPGTSVHGHLASYLVSQGLTNGYGTFSEAGPVTTLSKGKCLLRPIQTNTTRKVLCTPTRFTFTQPRGGWFNKRSWYNKSANFVVFRKVGYWYRVTEEGVLAGFGTPKKRLSYGEFRIFVYDYDITKKLAR